MRPKPSPTFPVFAIPVFAIPSFARSSFAVSAFPAPTSTTSTFADPWRRYGRVVFVTAILSLTISHSAAAISLTNRDTREHKVSIAEGSATVDHALKPGDALASVCLKGCIIRLNGSENDEYELEGDEIVSIEDGYLYYDGPEAPSGAAPSAPIAPPVQPK